MDEFDRMGIERADVEEAADVAARELGQGATLAEVEVVGSDTDALNRWRDGIAHAMWAQYQETLNQRDNH